MKNYELQAFLQFDDGGSGNAAANQSFNVTIARNGSGDATIYQDAAGTIELVRPFSTDQYGRFKFYAPNGYYNILFDDPDVANLNNLLDRDIFAVEAATTEQSGLVELATQTEMDSGAANVVPTADVVKTYVDAQSGSGEANTTSNSGAGAGLALPKAGVDLPFKSLIGGSNVTITEQADTVIISSTASGGATNLSYTASPTEGVVTSDTGTDATIPAGSTTNASLMLPADKTKLDNVGAGAQLVSVQAGTNVTVDSTDPQNPIISATGGGGGGGDYTISAGSLEVLALGVVSTSTSSTFYIQNERGVKATGVTATGTFRVQQVGGGTATSIAPSAISIKAADNAVNCTAIKVDHSTSLASGSSCTLKADSGSTASLVISYS